MDLMESIVTLKKLLRIWKWNFKSKTNRWENNSLKVRGFSKQWMACNLQCNQFLKQWILLCKMLKELSRFLILKETLLLLISNIAKPSVTTLSKSLDSFVATLYSTLYLTHPLTIQYWLDIVRNLCSLLMNSLALQLLMPITFNYLIQSIITIKTTTHCTCLKHKST